MKNVTLIEPSVTVRTATDFKTTLLALAEQGQDATLDLADIVEVDLSFVQTLQAARTRFAQDGHALRLSAPAPAAVAALLDRAGFLSDPTPADIDFWFHGELPR